MFENLSESLSKTVRNLKGIGRLTEANMQETLKEVRYALIQADVGLPIVKKFVQDIEEKAKGQEVSKALDPGQALTKIVNEELTRLMGESNAELDLSTQPPAVILMAGLQGSGKTTTAAKLAVFLKEQKKKVMLTSADVYRPAAIKQLEKLASETGSAYFPSTSDDKPTKIAKNAIAQAKKEGMDVLILDTAGRMHIDSEMMDEIKTIHKVASPVETLFVVDSMAGQDAAITAKAFHEALPITGVILTKADGDSRGGAALTVREITGQPIKFLGTGEKTDALEAFHPDRMASRILGMGDVMSLIEEAEKKLDSEKSKKLAKKIKKGKGFTLEDFREQLLQMENMGSISGILDKIPGMSQAKGMIEDKMADGMTKKMVAIISSMTMKERNFPDLLNGSRKRRIAKGSGTELVDVNRLLKQFTKMQKMMKKFKKPGAMQNLMNQMGGMMPPGGKMPDGF